MRPEMIDEGGDKFIQTAQRLAKECGYRADVMLERAPEQDRFGAKAVEKLRDILSALGALPSAEERAQRSSADGLRVALDAHIHTHIDADLRDAISAERELLLGWFPST